MNEVANEIIDCDLCILGAGIAGLNALFAASRRLPSGQKIALVDRRDAPAGMWHEVYDYVRLHQPHPMFTAGNIAWQGQADPHYLANKREVVDHLQRCFAVLKERTQLEPRLGHEYLGHEDSGSGERPITVHCRRVADDADVTIRARRLIKAFGYDVRPAEPLKLTSNAVVSLSPDHCDLLGPEVTQAAGDIYVVGGGKTGMDTAHTLVERARGKSVRMLIGAGTMFINRDVVTPQGLRRHWGGATTLELFLDVAGRFDGHNEVETMAYFRRTYGVALDDGCRRFMFGVLSATENQAIRDGVTEIIRDHLVDVVDGPNGPEMILRSGARRPMKPGSVVLNATGYVGHSRNAYEPYLSATGNVLSIQPTSTTHFLSSQAAYFLTHLFITGELASLPLYEVDVAELRDASRDAFPAAAIALTLYNTSVIVNSLPRWVMNENGLDFLLLFPVHRRLLAFVKLMRFLKQRPNHLPKVMDTVRERFGVRLGPIAASQRLIA
jgi:cation diffusion facilitator CzcD-associated flavoprotein CzcO